MKTMAKIRTSVYEDHGYEDREHYLESVAEDHGVSLDAVWALANLLGPGEDFDGMVTLVQDLADQEDFN